VLHKIAQNVGDAWAVGAQCWQVRRHRERDSASRKVEAQAVDALPDDLSQADINDPYGLVAQEGEVQQFVNSPLHVVRGLADARHVFSHGLRAPRVEIRFEEGCEPRDGDHGSFKFVGDGAGETLEFHVLAFQFPDHQLAILLDRPGPCAVNGDL